jgi:hypothetical protein
MYVKPQKGMTVEINAETAFRQPMSAAHDYMGSAKQNIDDMFGEGYAAEHPDLIAAYMRTAAKDFFTASLSYSLQSIARAQVDIAGAIGGLQDAFEGPLRAREKRMEG